MSPTITYALQLLFVFNAFAAPPTANELKIDYYEKLINNQVKTAWTNPNYQNSLQFKPKSNKMHNGGTYDYIVVGAGAAGSVIATRLSELEDAAVLLLEAGNFENDFVQIPSYFVYNQGLVNWNYSSTPQTTCCTAYKNRACAVPRGRVTGGTTVLNSLMYVRGSSLNYDQWAAAGNTGWSYADVLPYFIKSENSQIDGDPGYHGIGGYQNVEYYQGPYSPQARAFYRACDLHRIPYLNDCNGPSDVGVARVPYNTIDGVRDSASHAFLRYAIERDNLRVLVRSLVTRVLIRDGTAVGVEYAHGGRLYHAHARREVILSGGAINSPQLLMLSGIGPRAHLTEMGIDVVQDLPMVGENLIDHPGMLQLLFTTNITYKSAPLRRQLAEYLAGQGPLSIAGNNQAIVFQRSKLAGPDQAPDIELILVPTPSVSAFQKRAYGFTDESWAEAMHDIDPARTFNVFAIVVQPRSRGRVTLTSRSPYAYPAIDVRYLADANGEDIEIMYEAVRLAIDLVESPPFAWMNARVAYRPVAACNKKEPLSRAYWECQLRALTMSMYHPMSTCRMDVDRRLGVVDPELRVHGVRGLRVADASVIPFSVSGHTSAPSVMIGEKVSDMIKASRGR